MIAAVAIGSGSLCASVVPGVAAQTSSSSIGLTAADVPGFTAVDPSVTSYQNPDDDFVKAWRSCSAGDPLLSQLDSGPAATASTVFGQGSDGYGAPQFEVASLVFDAPSAAQAAAAFSALSASGFGSCIAKVADKNNAAEGFAPQQPSTAARVACPAVAPRCTAFDVHEVSSLGTGDLTVVGLYAGAFVSVLVANGVNGPFPGPTLQRLVRVLATRTGESSPAQGASGNCGLVVGQSTVTVLTTDQVSAALGETVSFAGEQPGAYEGGISTHICTWNGPPLRGSGLIGNDSLRLTVSDPSTQASDQFARDEESQRQDFAHQGYSVASVGDGAFFSGAQDAGQSLEVLTGDRLFTIDIRRSDAGQEAAQHAQLSLAMTVLAGLRPPTPVPAACSPVTGGPGASVAQGLGASPDWLAIDPSADLVLDAVPTTTSDGAGFFNALNRTAVQSLVREVLVFDSRGQPDYPAVWKVLKAALESCLLSEDFVSSLVTTPDDPAGLNTIYTNLAGDTAASAGLMRPMNAQEVAAGLSADPGVTAIQPGSQMQTVDQEYGHVAASALAGDIVSLLGAGKEFPLPTAVALNGLSAEWYFDQAPGVPGGNGANNLTDLSGDPVVTAAQSYIESSIPPAPQAWLDFRAGNSWVNAQLPLTGTTLTPAPNDIVGDPQGGPSAGLYYFNDWASSAAVLQFMVVDGLALQQENSVLNLAGGESLLMNFFSCLGDVGSVAAFGQDLTAVAKAHLDSNTDQQVYTGLLVVKDALEITDTRLLPALGAVLCPVNLFLSAPDPDAVARAQKTAGELLCDQELGMENDLVGRLQSDNRLLVDGHVTRGAVDAPSVYETRGGAPVATFASDKGTDTGSAVFPTLNAAQATWRIMVNGEIPPADYEACPLGGQDPTLSRYEMPVDGSGYAPNSQVTIIGHSTPAVLARTRADAAGRFDLFVDPRQLGVGRHEILAQGRTPSGGARVLRWAVDVTRGGSDRSPATEWVWLLLGGLVVVLAGATAFWRRRNKSR